MLEKPVKPQFRDTINTGHNTQIQGKQNEKNTAREAKKMSKTDPPKHER